MTKSQTIQNSFLSGVLDPRAFGRVDTETYNNALSAGENVVVHHLGGVYRRPGLKYLQTLGQVLTFQTPSAATVPSGGTAANGYDDDLSTKVVTTSNVGTTDPYVVVRYDLGSAKAVTHADVHEIVATGSTSDEFRIQYSTDDAVWNDFGAAFPLVDTTERTYRRTQLSSGEFSSVSAQYWRVVKVGGTDMGSNTISISEFNVWVQDTTVSAAKLVSYEVSAETRYLIALTDRSAAVYLDGAVVSTFPLPYASAELGEVDVATDDGVVFFVHEDHAVRYLLDEFTGSDFQVAEYPILSTPQFDFNDSSSPSPTSEVQVITFDANWNAGDSYQIQLDNSRTGEIIYAGDTVADQQNATAENIRREVQKLFAVPGYTGVSCARTGALTYTVTFAGASAKEYNTIMSLTPIETVNAAASATVALSVSGVSRSEDVWSATRGYPRTVALHGGRLYFGGSKKKLQTLFGSSVNDLQTFEAEDQLAADPIFVTLNGQKLNAITGLFSGRTLEVFTTGGEFRYVKQRGEAITPEDFPAAQTQYGTKRIRPVGIDGVTIFVQRLGKSVRDFRFDFEEDSYNSLGLSSLAPHLINGIVDIDAWQGSSTDEINLVYLVNTDGTVAVLNIRREADVRAWTRWTTQGSFKAVATSIEETYFAVERSIAGTTKVFLEQLDSDYYVDAGANVVGGAANNMSHISTETCRVRLQTDHLVLSDQDGPTITPSETTYASANIQAGFEFNPSVAPMPLVTNTREGSSFMRKARIVKAYVKVKDTLGLKVNDRELPDRFYDIDSFDTAPEPFSGNISLEETTNWDEKEDKLVTFTQVDPLPMNILALAVELES
jgi:hypothetical protein